MLDHGFSRLAIRWIASYLSDRVQATYVKLNTGVPQASVLGLLLFTIYVSDISFWLDHNVSHLMYANDLQVYIHCPLVELDFFFTKININAIRIINWTSQNLLRLNVGKTKAIVISSRSIIILKSQNVCPSVRPSGQPSVFYPVLHVYKELSKGLKKG